MILNFSKVILHNFASYSHAEIDLANKGFCLVSGRNNYKKDNSYSNGSGKSFIWNGICFTLTGETMTGIHSGLKNLLIDEDLSYTTVEFSVDADQFEITRSIAPKSDLKIIRNGVDVSGKGITESKKKLAELLPDLSKDLIASTFIIGQGMPNAFSKFSPSGRKDIIERLTKSEFMIEEVKKRINTRLNVLTKQLREHEDCLLINNTKLNEANTFLTSSKEKLTTMIKPNFDAEIATVKQQIVNLSTQLEDLNRVIQEKDLLLTKLDTDISQINAKQTAELDDVTKEYLASVSGGHTKRTALMSEYSTIAADIKNILNEINKIKNIKEFCPTCGHKLDGVTKPSTTELENNLTAKQQALQSKQAEITAVDLKLKEVDAIKEQVVSEIKDRYNSELSPIQTQRMSLPTELTKLRSTQTVLISTMGMLQSKQVGLETDSKNWDEKYNALLTDIKNAEELVKVLTATGETENIKKLDTEEHLATVKKIDTLAKRDLRGRLLTNIVTYINKRAKDFSDIVFGTRELTVELNGNNLDITYCGKMFDNLSGGEKMRVDLILQLAIRDMLKTYLNTHANILVLDEITDFLDKQSCKAVMTLLEQELNTVESVFVISHHTDELALPIDTELKISKSVDGISTII